MISLADKIEKVTIESELNRYGKSMQRNIDSKSEFVMTNLSRKNGGKTLDIGCCDGSLLKKLKEINPNHDYIGIDISEGFISKAQKECKNIEFKKMDAFKVESEMGKEQFNNVIISSVLHEIYSYSEIPYSKTAIKQIFKELYKLVKKEGRIIILDPAKPIDPNKIIKVVFNSENGSNNYSERNIGALSTLAKFKKFTNEFKAISKVKILLLGDQNTYVMNSWLFTEFLRHRNLHETPSHWNSEMKEVYGTLTPNEIIKIALEVGFNIVIANNFYKPNHFSSPSPEEFQVFTENERINIEDIYNSHSRYVFQK